MKKNLLFIFTIFSFVFTYAQNSTINLKENNLKDLKNSHAKFRTFENKTERDIYDKHFKALEHQIDKGYIKDQFVTEHEFTDFIAQIFNFIKNGNPGYNINDSKVYILKNNIPNATSYGFNHYLVYNGVFNLAENEFQLASIICHEMAHNHLNHTIEQIKKEAEFLTDFKKEIRSIKKKEFIKLIKSQDEIIQKKYDLANQSRLKEIAADSLGFVFYSSAGFPKSEYLEMLNRLDKYDAKNTKSIKDSTYHSLFVPAGITIEPKWLKLEKEELFAGLSFTEHVDKDSVRSHPNTNDRKKWIAEKFKVENIKDETINPSEEFIKLKEIVVNQFYETLFFNNNYDHAVYLLMNEKQEKSERKNLDKNIGIAFEKLHEARLKHEFNKYVPIADANDEDKDYHKFLNFLWNLSTPDLKLIADYYTKKAAQ